MLQGKNPGSFTQARGVHSPLSKRSSLPTQYGHLVNPVIMSKKKSTANRAQKQKRREFRFRLAILTALTATLLALAGTGFLRTAKLIIHVSRLIFLAGPSLTRGQVVILFATRTLLTVHVLLTGLTCSTHVPVKIVVLHSVVCHVRVLPPMCVPVLMPPLTNQYACQQDAL